MANEEQLSILRQGVDVWNKWRNDEQDVEIDLRGADLNYLDLSHANFNHADFTGADLEHALLVGVNFRDADLSTANLLHAKLVGGNLIGTKLRDANLREADLVHASLMGARLGGARMGYANMRDANLQGANLIEANLSEASLVKANLREAELTNAVFIGTDLNGTQFEKAIINHTVFGDVDLSKTEGLEEAFYSGPSLLSTSTIQLSKGKIPIVCLQGCGLSDWEIEQVKLYNPDLSNEEISNIQYGMYNLRATQALQVSPLFISYSHADREFVDKIGECLADKGIRYWRDIHDLKAGRIEKQIDKAIGQNRTVLLVISEHSLKSDWVEHEVRTARGLEKEIHRDILCPVALDDSWKDSPWPKRVMEQVMEYNVLDFSEWQDDKKFDVIFRRLIEGLELFYKG